MLDVLGSDYLRTAQAKGLRRRTVLLKHGPAHRTDPDLDVSSAYGFLALFTGAIFTEIIYNWHGTWGRGSSIPSAKSDVNSVQAVNVFAAGPGCLLSGFVSDVFARRPSIPGFAADETSRASCSSSPRPPTRRRWPSCPVDGVG